MNKKIVLPLILFLIMFLVANPVVSTNVVKDTLSLWYTKVLPPLLPTLILVKMVLGCNFSTNKIQPFCLLSGIFCGFPIGATISMDYVKKGILSKEDGLLYATFFNQFSLAFLISYIGYDCLNIQAAEIICIIYSAQFLLFLSFKLYYYKNNKHHFHPTQLHKNETFTTDVNYKVVDASIISSCEALIKICGYMVICNLINAFLFEISKNQLLYALLAPILELTGGAANLANSSLPDSFIRSFLPAAVSFGGLSGVFQVSHVLKEADVSIYQYVILKIISFLITGLVAYIYFYQLLG